jgi:hypothetical protein
MTVPVNQVITSNNNITDDMQMSKNESATTRTTSVHLSTLHTNGEQDKAMRHVSLESQQQERATLRILIRGLHFSLFLVGDSLVVWLEVNDSLLAIY